MGTTSETGFFRQPTENEMFGIVLAIAMIPLAMQVCTPAVAATRITI